MDKHRGEWISMLTIVCVLLGALLALTVKTQARRPGIPGINNPEQLTREWWAMQDKILELQSQLSNSHGGHTTSAEEDRLTMLAATTPVSGPGVTVTLKDNPQIAGPKLDPALNPDLSYVGAGMIHDVDVLRVVNELFAAGAEAITVDGQRIGARTAIRCVGPVVNVNGVGCAEPFIIEAIGDSNTLDRALELPGGVVAELRGVGCPVEIQQESKLVLAAFDGAVNFPHAHPIHLKTKRAES